MQRDGDTLGGGFAEFAGSAAPVLYQRVKIIIGPSDDDSGE